MEVKLRNIFSVHALQTIFFYIAAAIKYYKE